MESGLNTVQTIRRGAGPYALSILTFGPRHTTACASAPGVAWRDWVHVLKRIVIGGAAGLVGQNLIPHLKAAGRYEIVAIDKHAANVKVLRSLHPDIRVIEADLAEPGAWEEEAAACEGMIMLQAQIGGLDPEPFLRNNITSTERMLAAAEKGKRPYVVHISSSVVNSAADDLYTRSKKAQEAIVAKTSLKHIILRPTLMFGWFDRKHLGWLRRFMDKSPVFPIPGNGRYLRQPLYGGDFARIVAAALDGEMTGAYNISGLQKIDYVDLIKAIKRVAKGKATIVHIPYGIFRMLLQVYAVFDRDPPFTTAQLKALVTPDLFEEIDWPGIFGVRQTPLEEALSETYLDPKYSSVVLEF
jgi:nucleoside-diphosphate-sugar epimerase